MIKDIDSLSLLCSEEFRTLWAEVNRKTILWEDFRRRPMPEGLTAEEMWEVISRLRKDAGFSFDYPPWFAEKAEGSIWFSVPKDSQERLRRIMAATAGSSSLAEAIAKFDSYYFCLYLMFDELLTACDLDGVTLEKHHAKDIAFLRQAPKTDEELMFANLCEVFSMAEQLFAEQGLDYGLVDAIPRRLSKGLSGEVGFLACRSEVPLSDYYSADRALDMVISLARGKSSSDPIDPILASMEFSNIFLDLKPLPRLNACVELVLRKVFFIRKGFSGCAYLGLAGIACDLRLHEYEQIGAPTERGSIAVPYRMFGADGTLYHDLILKKMEEEIDGLSHKVERFASNRRKQKRLLSSMDEINVREQDVLLELLRNPVSSVTIERHRCRHGVAYSTAHDDLAHLAALGYLRAVREGHAMFYYPGERLVELI